MNYSEVVSFLESLQIMPKTMPGLQKINRALVQTDWFSSIDPKKVIVVAGTNGKGTTCAALQSLLLAADQRVGFYSSPHLVSTTERIRINGLEISENNFVEVFHDCKKLIQECELSHFEALTLMAGHYFFSSKWNGNLDFVILEVGLGGTYDATNAFPHKFCAITKLGLDHLNILGTDLVSVASNKFGIVTNKSIVVHHRLPEEVMELKYQVQKETNSNWVEAEVATLHKDTRAPVPRYRIDYMANKIPTNLTGERAFENIMTAITLFQILGFDIESAYQGLARIDWKGRMQKILWPQMKAPLFLSGDHNAQGVESLIELLKDFKWKRLHLVVGIGVDKDVKEMLSQLMKLSSVSLYLTETPFKGLTVGQYPQEFLEQAKSTSPNVKDILDQVAVIADEDDLCIVTGSLYLVGEVLKIAPSAVPSTSSQR
ncbi:bifunctional folylpolyglutamate synthase/dihydrofolate synthase [Pseudobdellovibrio exovorus]|uniref:Dihydrofolate synthase/folylpolyglutamate synthase n=1 Tax=Pseudobdellovibrio exovorus JSS TaxID=1184267 RepID=M4V6N1_9BACT|nr:Mur ligase family protein [Pseudobdellovibrio exovorus]AGH95017.1 hypothetical protein A11Q_799 [Pseudobdellovibrio exovorus JSS]